MLAPAPVIFSMTTDWPSDVRMRSPRMRASVSVGPPAGNGTIIVIGRDGKVCAWTGATPPTAMAKAAAMHVICFMIFLACSPLIFLQR